MTTDIVAAVVVYVSDANANVDDDVVDVNASLNSCTNVVTNTLIYLHTHGHALYSDERKVDKNLKDNKTKWKFN